MSAAPTTQGERDATARDRPRIGRHLRREIDRLLAGPPAEDAARATAALRRAGAHAWRAMKRHPIAATVAAAGLGLAAAELVGMPEIVLALAFGYVAYDVLREGASPEAAVAEVVAKGLL
jgi:hypothetical protein